jgi:hypothetical protein
VWPLESNILLVAHVSIDMKVFILSVLCLMAMLPPFSLSAGEKSGQPYDPLVVESSFHASRCDLTVHDEARNRDIPIRVYLPVTTPAAPVVLFSHGLGGSCAGSAFHGEHWAARGYVSSAFHRNGLTCFCLAQQNQVVGLIFWRQRIFHVHLDGAGEQPFLACSANAGAAFEIQVQAGRLASFQNCLAR